MNIDCTKLKLRAPANQAIYLVIFHLVAATLYPSLLMLLLDLCRGLERVVVSLAICPQICFSELSLPYAENGGTHPPHPRPGLTKFIMIHLV